MIKRIAACLLALSIVFCLAAAQAVSYPDRRGAVNDDAAVLSESSATDVDLLNDRSSARFTVVTRHFLGGADAQQYCNELFSSWNLGKDDLLLLLVIGEERYAVAMGESIRKNALSDERLNTLFSSKLRQPFIIDRNYDRAVGDFLLAAAQQVASANGETLNINGLFGATQATSQQSTASSGNHGSGFWSSFYSNSYPDDGQQESVNYDYEEDSGFSVGKMILIVAVFLIIIRNRHKKTISAAPFPMGRQGMNGAPGRRVPPRR